MPMNVEDVEDELRVSWKWRRNPLVVLLLMFGVFVEKYGTAEGTACFSDYDKSRQLASNLKLVGRPQVTDGILRYCDDHQLCTITCMNMNPNPFGVSSNFELDDQCFTLAEIEERSGYVVLEEESVNTTIQFPCYLVGSVRCIIDDEHFSAVITIAKDEEENCASQVPATSAPSSGTPTVSTGSTGPAASTGSTIKPDSPTEKDYSGFIAPIVVIMAVILLVVMITLVAALCYCYQYKKLCWRESVQREEIEIPDDTEHGNLTLVSASSGSSHTNIPDSTAGDNVGDVSETTEHFAGGSMPDLDQNQVAEPIVNQEQEMVSAVNQEQEVVSIVNQEQEVLASPVEEETHPLVMGQRNEPDGRDENAETGLPKPVQATD